MWFRQRSANDMVRQMGVLFAAIGVLFAVAALLGAYAQARQKQKYIREVVAVTDTDRHTGRTQVFYKVDGRPYTVWLDYYSSMKLPGDTMVAYYDPEEPGHVVVHTPWLCAALLAPGGRAFFAGIGMCRWAVSRKRRAKRLREDGQCMEAEIVRVETDRRFRQNRRYAKYLVCQYQDLDGAIYVYKSEPFFGDTPHLQPGMKVAVYRERGNGENYYVDYGPVIEKEKAKARRSSEDEKQDADPD